jgi:hypothetical protein
MTELENTNTDLNYTNKKLKDATEENEKLQMELKAVNISYE